MSPPSDYSFWPVQKYVFVTGKETRDFRNIDGAASSDFRMRLSFANKVPHSIVAGGVSS